MSRNDKSAIALALKALEHHEWTGDYQVFSPQCFWCGGYKRQPAMDQDYYGQPGHKADCIRQRAIEALKLILEAT